MKALCCDVGTSSVRVAIMEFLPGNVLNTKPLAVSSEPVTISNRQKDFYEQSTKEVWSAFCTCVCKCLKQVDFDSVNLTDFPIDAIAFSATCSLVIVDKEPSKHEYDIIMWMDHRSKKEAEIINQSQHQVLDQFGGTCSPEFSLSKLFWLFNNDRTRFHSASAFMELSDWMTYRCSSLFGSPHKFPRSLCCVTCKWGYDSQNRKWREDLFELLGMTWNESLHDQIGKFIITPGIRVASLSVAAARDMGFVFTDEPSTELVESVSLASSLIDAHSGVISMLIFGNRLPRSVDDTKQSDPFENVFCMISGTSTCHMVLNKSPSFTKGVWGPYLDVIIPGYHLREAGQSATGQLIEQVIKSYYNDKLPSSISQIITNLNQQLQAKLLDHRTGLIVNPTFHGNRSPLANSHLKGAIYGFTLEKTSLLDLYVATMEGIAYETRLIFERIQNSSQPIRSIIVTGGLAKNDLYLQLHSDILGAELVTFSAGEADLMLVGAAVIAFTSAQISNDDEQNRHRLLQILKQELKIDSHGFNIRVFKPRTASVEYHKAKYECYRRLLDCCVQIETILSNDLIV